MPITTDRDLSGLYRNQGSAFAPERAAEDTSSNRYLEAAGSGLLKGAEEIANLYGLLPYMTDEKYRFGFAPVFEPRGAAERALYTGARYIPDVIPFGGGTALARVGIRAALKRGALKGSPRLAARLERTTPGESLKLGVYSELGAAAGAGTASAVAPDSALAELGGALAGGITGGYAGLRKLRFDVPDKPKKDPTVLESAYSVLGYGPRDYSQGLDRKGMGALDSVKSRFIDSYHMFTAAAKKVIPASSRGTDLGGTLQAEAGSVWTRAKAAGLDAQNKVYGPIEVKGKIPVKDLEASNVYVKLLGDRERVMADIDTPQHGVKGELLTLKGIDDAIDDLEKNVIKKRGQSVWENIKEVAKRHGEHMQEAVERLDAEGLLTPETYKKLRGKQFYAPMRIIQAADEIYKQLTRGEVGDKLLWKPVEGATDHTKKVGIPSDELLLYTQRLELFIQHNKRNKNLSDLFSEKGKLLQGPKPGSPGYDLKSREAYRKEVDRQAKEAFPELFETDKRAAIAKYTKARDEVIQFYVDPKKDYKGYTKFYFREDEGQVRAFALANEYAGYLKGLNTQEASYLVGAAGKAGNIFRLGATGANFAFIVPNLIADAMRATFISAAGPKLFNPVDFAKFLGAHFRGLGAAFNANFRGKFNEAWDDALHAGVLNSGLTRGLAPPDVFDPLAEKGLVKNILSKVPQFTAMLEDTWKIAGVQRMKEASPFLKGQSFKKLVGKKGLSSIDPDEALEALNVLRKEVRRYAGSPDFARRGSLFRGQRLENLNLLFMFTNARIQGTVSDLDRLTVPFRRGRLGKNITPADRAAANKALANISTFIGLPTLYLTGYNLKDKESRDNYFKIPEWEREKYWMIPMHGKFFKNEQGDTVQDYIRIPKRDPFRLFSNTIEATVMQFLAPHIGEGIPDKDRKSFGEWMSRLLDNVVQEIVPVEVGGDTVAERAESVASGLNPLLRVPVETVINRNFWAHRPIVPEYVRAPGGRAVKAEYLKAHQVYKEGTNELYKGLSSLAGSKGIEITPLKIQHFLEGYTANLLAQLFPSSNREVLEKMFNVQKIPVIGKVAQRFQRSAYIDKSREFRRLREALGKQEFDSWTNNEFASRFIDAMYDPDSRTTPEEKEAILSDYRSNRDFQVEVARVLKQMELGRTSLDNMFMRLSVKGGTRARLMSEVLMELPEGDRNDRLREWAKKGMLDSRVVRGQMGYYMRRL